MTGDLTSQAWGLIIFTGIFAVVVVCTLCYGAYALIRHNPAPQPRPVSKRRLSRMWVVDDDDGYVHVVPRYPRRGDVQMYDEEA